MSIRDRHAQMIIQEHQKKLLKRMPSGGKLPSLHQRILRGPADSPVTVGIIGAGAAGLYASLIIDSLADSRITYEIFDANPMKDRSGGGRLFTYNFPNGGPNDYFDVGAMRFPDIPFMKPVFQLIRDNPNSPIAGMLDVIDFRPSDPNSSDLKFYNGIIKTQAELDVTPPPLDPFNTGIDPPDTVFNMFNAAIGDFKDRFTDTSIAFADAWNNLMQWDQYSTRNYMAFVKPLYPDPLINYLETFNSATNVYDEALAETVMDSLNFEYGENVSWYCIQGGAGLIADAMIKKMAKPVENGKRVIAIAPIVDARSLSATSVSVTVADEPGPRTYTHVISTMPLSCLRMVDTAQCGFDWTFQTAIRDLHYDSGVKVAIRFSRRWWENSSLANGPHAGGVSTTDRPTCAVIYPSYGIGETTGATMIVSYSWAQDAIRFGALAQTSAEPLMIQSIIKDLADMHDMDYTTLSGLVEDHKIHDWYADEYAAGACAVFCPGQFNTLYPAVTQPVGGLLHFAGEATSVHHSWVVGAFNSAYRTIYEVLLHEGFTDLITKMQATWPAPDEFDPSLLAQQVALGQDIKFKKDASR